MKTHEIREAIQDAERTIRAAENVTSDLAYLLIGRLRNCSSNYTLKQLKNELKNYNSHTGQWKS